MFFKKYVLLFVINFIFIGNTFGQIRKVKKPSKMDNKIALTFGFREFEGEADAKFKGFGQRLTPWFTFSYSKQLMPAAGIRASLGGC